MVLGKHRDIGCDVGLRRYLLQDVVVILPRHQLIHELVGPFNDLVDLFDLLLLYFLLAAFPHPFVLAVLLDCPSEGVAEGVVVDALLDWGLVEGERQRLDGIHIGEDIDVLVGYGWGFLLLLLLPTHTVVERVEFQISDELLLVLEVIQNLWKSLLILFQKDADGEDKAAAVPIHQILDDVVKLLFEKQLCILLESGRLQHDLSQRDPVVLLLHFRATLVEVVEVVAGFDEPVPEFDLLLLGDDDVVGGEAAVDDVIFVHGSDALDDGSEGIDDFFFIEMDDVVAPLPILHLHLQRRLLLGVQQSVIILDGLYEGLVHQAAVLLGIGVDLEVLVGLLGRLVQEKDVVWFEFYYHELFA